MHNKNKEQIIIFAYFNLFKRAFILILPIGNVRNANFHFVTKNKE